VSGPVGEKWWLGWVLPIGAAFVSIRCCTRLHRVALAASGAAIWGDIFVRILLSKSDTAQRPEAEVSGPKITLARTNRLPGRLIGGLACVFSGVP
jgi:hypothetical protein